MLMSLCEVPSKLIKAVTLCRTYKANKQEIEKQKFKYYNLRAKFTKSNKLSKTLA